ncbi:cytochrome C oxidase subunit IV family protein [Bradyrhizobium sp. HKCCYLS1011]|uniref:cytochrome C oxidase subunit IV family protein n=1 Tax=Bradyrhizobium sp. HKCCYLS1011 TaxID=3420733 RepID=UPI003EBC53B0
MFGPDRLDVTWLMLLGLAVATVAISSSGAGALLGNTLVLALAAIKGRKIILDYLGLRAAPALWRGLITTWIVGLAAFAWATAALRALI